MENENNKKQRTLSFNDENFLVPSYWTEEDIVQWNTLVDDDDFEIRDLLSIPYHAAKILNGEERLETINESAMLSLSHEIKTVEDLIEEEKRIRENLWSHFQEKQKKIQEMQEHPSLKENGNHENDFISETPIPPKPFEILERTEVFPYAGGKVSGFDYIVRVDNKMKNEIAPSLRTIKENEQLFVRYRKMNDREELWNDFSPYIMKRNSDGTYSPSDDRNSFLSLNRLSSIADSYGFVTKQMEQFKQDVRDMAIEYEKTQTNSVNESTIDSKLTELEAEVENKTNAPIYERPVDEMEQTETLFVADNAQINIPVVNVSEEEFNRWEEALDGIENNPEELYRVVHGAPKSVGETIDDGIEQTQVNGGERLKEKEGEEKHAKNLLSDISNVLDEGTVYSARNNNENIELRRGQKRTGLIHIITRRYEEKVLNKKMNMPPEQAMKEISALSYLIADSLDKGELKQTPKGNWEINQNGIQSIITKDKNGKFVLTGYEFNDNIEVARNSINAVIAQYGDTPEFLGVYAQVGAALTSYGYNITSQNSPVNEQSNSSLEQSTLEKAADLLKNMSFSSENYKELLEVINKISSMNGLENLEAPKEPESIEKVAQAGQGENKNAPGKSFDPKAPIVYGETVLPAFAVMADGKLQSVENAVVTGYDKSSQIYTIESGGEKMRLPKATLETLLDDKREQEQAQARLAEGKTIVFEDKDRGVKGTVIPEFAMYTQNGLESFKGFVATHFNASEKPYTLSNGDSKMTVTEEQFKEMTAPERFKNHFDEKSPTYMKLCETQYNDFFRQRDNTAYNFPHNLAVYCRKEANSPVDAMRLAKLLVQKMPKDEQKKTEKLLQKMAHEHESTNELIARMYHESIKGMPLNEDYIKTYQPEKVIVRPFYDTISDSGKKIENDPSLVKGSSDRNLKIGDTLRDVDIRMEKLFGKGSESMRFDELKVVSASKEGNSITLMDANRSFFKLPRDIVLQAHKEQQLKEMKQEQRHSRANSMSFAYA